jgi:hypothetical protein
MIQISVFVLLKSAPKHRCLFMFVLMVMSGKNVNLKEKPSTMKAWTMGFYRVKILKNCKIVECVSQDCILFENSVERLTQPTVAQDGHKAPEYRFECPRAMALIAALTLFLHEPNGFRNRDLRIHIANLLGVDDMQYHSGKITNDL